MKTFIFCSVLALIQCEIPPIFRRCYRRDPNFKKCYMEAAQHGLQQLTKPYKSLGLPNMEPLDVPVLNIKGGGGTVAVDQNFEDCKLYGLTTIKFERFELDFEQETLDSLGTAPELRFECRYKLDGKVLLLPIQGDGNSTVIMKDFRLKFHAQYETIRKGVKTYYKTVNSGLNATLSHVYFQLDNLFNGNKQLGDNINQVLNDNWEVIYDEIRPQYLEIVNQIMLGMTERIWSKVSLEEFFDN